MQLVEQHVIKRTDPRFAAIDAVAFASKNLYNAANYELRQAFIHEGIYLTYHEMHRRMKDHEVYKVLPAKVAQWVLRTLDKNWQSFFAALAAWKADPSRFLGRPRLPRYKDKQQGRNLLVYTIQALSVPALRKGILLPSMLGIAVRTQQHNVQQVRIVPRLGYYMVEVVYERQEALPTGDPALYAAIDLGVDNLAAITSNKAGFIPRLVNGRPIKSTNQFYNKRRAALQAVIGAPSGTGITARMERLTCRRTRRIQHYLHTASKAIIALLVAEGIETLVIGKNPGWKQVVELGRVNNQHFVQLPHARFIQMLTYKAQLAGMRVVLQEESYTSKASFLDGDPLPVYNLKREGVPVFSGKRVKRGLYRAQDGRILNADVNGSYNILRKALPDAFGSGSRCGRGKGIEAVVVRPVGLTFVWSVPPRARAAA